MLRRAAPRRVLSLIGDFNQMLANEETSPPARPLPERARARMLRH